MYLTKTLLVEARPPVHVLDICNENGGAVYQREVRCNGLITVVMNVMDVYMRRAGGTRSGKFHRSAPFRYLAATRFLSAHPKFRGSTAHRCVREQVSLGEH